ncbi:MAG TPA: DUF1254 domain-containing protein [Thermomicrobiales bacterium]|jgi:hypothetical protein
MTASTADLQEQLVFPRAVEAAIWGMPAVSMAAFRASLKRDLDANFGDVVYMSNVMEPRHGFLTANNQTPYVATVSDLRNGPMVVEVPPASDKVALFGSGIDTWEVPLVDMGPSGDDAGKGGKYLFLPPDYSGTAPEGYFVVPSPTVFVHTALRPIPIGSGTLADAVAYSQRLKTYALADAANPPATRFVDCYPLTWDTLPPFDLRYFALLAEVIQEEPWQPRDAVMAHMLTSIGIEKGKPFAPSAERAELLARAVTQAQELMRDYFVHRSGDAWWPDRQWTALNRGETFGFSFYGDGALDYDHRGGGFTFFATWAPKKLGEPGKLPASFYLKGLADASGEFFKGDRLYRLRVPADTPARDFWSVIAYANDTNGFIPNPQNRVGVSSYDKGKLTVNADGSVDVYIGPEAPEGLEQNWIPTAGEEFWLIFRFYGPEQPLFDKTWTLNDVAAADASGPVQ